MAGLDALANVTPLEIGLAAALTIASFVGSLALVAFVVVRIPDDYFVAEAPPLPLAGRSMAVRVGARIGMNVLGFCLILAGLVLSLPGVPGQGILTILLGIMLMDLPGKRRLERWLVKRPMVHKGIDALRARWNRPPIRVPD